MHATAQAFVMHKKVIIGFGAAAFLGVAVALLLLPSGFLGTAEAQLNPQQSRSTSFALDCAAPAKPISPLIYGIGGADKPWSTGLTALRVGGNPASRYNWELDTWNAANDWYFKNVGGSAPGTGQDPFVDESRRYGVKVALTVPMLGWVAKDATSYSFPVKMFGPQQAVAPEQPDAGNGVAVDGKRLQPGPPTLTSVHSTPESVERFVRHMRERDRGRDRTIESYILDNEPMLWNSTHRDVHPQPTTYDELLDKTIAYGLAIRHADPGTKIAGPAEWGWLAYQYSAKDVAAGLTLRPDRRQHGDEALIPWYLRNLREYERRTGIKLLDILDVHFYPMADGVRGDTGGGKTDAATAAKRIRATRSLWDPTYKDESWINERMQVLRLLHRWIDADYPGLGISIGEWDFGGEAHMSGGLATAETLGRFGVEGVTSAYRWGSPAEKTPTFWAFRAFRNYDGKGAHFEDWSIPVTGDGTLISLFASRDESRRRVVAVLLNLAPLSPSTTDIALQGCGAAGTVRAFTYTGGQTGFYNLDVSLENDHVKARVSPYSMTVIELATDPSKP